MTEKTMTETRISLSGDMPSRLAKDVKENWHVRRVNRRTRRLIRHLRTLLKQFHELQIRGTAPAPKEVLFRAEELLIQIIPLLEESMKIKSVALRGVFIESKIDPLMDEFNELTKPYFMNMAELESASNAN